MASSFLSVVAFCVIGSITAEDVPPHAEPPLIPGHPFVAIWNTPTERCQSLRVPLDTAAFQVVSTPAAVPGQFLTIFYENRLGLYPKVKIANHKIYHGGIPQKGNLTEHLAKAQNQIAWYIPQDSTPGLVVIDWESWRPLWDQNWGSKSIYKKLSITHAQQKDPFASAKEVSNLAKSQFQSSAQRFMEKTISLGTSKRPSRRWGFYLFPDCYNYGWQDSKYTGKCSKKTQKRNNQMMWLWEHSTALFPSIYLQCQLSNSQKAKLYVGNRIQEALRVAALPKRPNTLPVYVYSRLLFRDQNQLFLTPADLVSTVGEAAALGASGIVMWGGSKDYNNEASCQSLSEYLTSTFNPYIVNVTAAAMLCSEALCQGKGRCVRKSYNSTHYLHLNHTHFSILRAEGKYVAIGLPSLADLQAWAEGFTCQCYAGDSCTPKLVQPTQIKVIWV